MYTFVCVCVCLSALNNTLSLCTECAKVHVMSGMQAQEASTVAMCSKRACITYVPAIVHVMSGMQAQEASTDAMCSKRACITYVPAIVHVMSGMQAQEASTIAMCSKRACITYVPAAAESVGYARYNSLQGNASVYWGIAPESFCRHPTFI